MECIFCSISQGKTPSAKIYEDNTSIAFLDINPASKGHVVITYKKHYENPEQIPQNEYINNATTTKFITTILQKTMKPRGFNIITNIGSVKNQQTTHTATHIIPIQGEEEIVIGWKPTRIEQQEFQKIGQQIREQIQQEIEKARENIQKHADQVIKQVKTKEEIKKIINELKVERVKKP